MNRFLNTPIELEKATRETAGNRLNDIANKMRIASVLGRARRTTQSHA